MKTVSMKDIAEMCNVSVATVSRVINKNGRYSKETEEKVLKAIKDTGFNININAKSLRMNKTFTIGILIPDITNLFFAELVNYIESISFKKGFSTIISSTNRDSKKEQSYLKMMVSQGVDGIIVISGDSNFVFNQPNTTTPYICIDRRPDRLDKTSLVSSDHYQGGFVAAEHLIEARCENPVIIINNPKSSSTKERIDGFRAYFESISKHFDTTQIINFKNLKLILQSAKRLPFDGAFVVNDLTAFKVIHLLKNYSYVVPEDVKVVGFDNTPFSRFSQPSLSTIEQNSFLIAETAVDMLLELINDSEGTQNKIIKYPVKLIERESSSVKYKKE